MNFSKVRIKNFRNIQNLETQFSPRLNVLLGQNGQGKTNLLEALYVLLRGDSFRYSDNDTLITKGSDNSLLLSQITQNELQYTLKVQITKSKKNHFLNDKKVSITDIKKSFSAVIFSPESLSAIKESSENRRFLVDDLLTTYDKRNSDIISAFKRALKTRNRILKNYQNELATKIETQSLLEALNPNYLTLASQLTHQRTQALKSLHREFNSAMQYITANQSDEIGIVYDISGLESLSLSRENIAEIMQKRMQELELAELAHGSSLVGPHKHDLKFLYGQNDSRFYCSQGQQRAIILAFKMAQIVYHRKAHGIYPVLMLDDVLSELDKQKRESLINFLHEIKTQIFVTTTDLTLPTSFNLDEMQVLNIDHGKIMS